MSVNPRHLIGKKIVAVDMQPFDDGKGGTAHDPVITLDDGSRLCFITEEIDSGDCYGVDIVRHVDKVPRVLCIRHKFGWCAIKPGAKLDKDAMRDSTACGHYVSFRLDSKVREPTCIDCKKAIADQLKNRKTKSHV